MDFRDVPHARGFVLTRDPLDQVAHFGRRELPHGWNLWCDDAVATESAQTSEGLFVLIRGHWADLSDDRDADESTAEALLRSLMLSEREFHEHLGRIAGRYVVLMLRDGAMRVYHDAIGLRSVYYSSTSPLVCSHLSLLLSLEPHPNHLPNKVALTAWDFSPVKDVLHLLPNHYLDLGSNEVRRYFPLEPNRYTGMSADDRLARVETLWQRELDLYAREYPRIAISVTGGLDSRLMLAMARNHVADYRGFTYTVSHRSSVWARSLNDDGRIVNRLLPYLRLKDHSFIHLDESEEVPQDLGTVIRSNAWTSHGHKLIPHYRATFPEADWLHLRGTAVEIVRKYWPRQEGLNDFENVIHRLQREGSPDLMKRAGELGYSSAMHGYELMDLVYWEVRMGKWHAELVNESDAAFETFVPISTREILELLLAFDDEERRDGYAVRELINRNDPVLNFWGTNDRRNIYEQQRDEEQSRRVFLRGHTARTEDGKKLDYPTPDGGFLHLPKESFLKGVTTTAIIDVPRSSGDLQFTVLNDYTSSSRGAFTWSVVVDSAEVLRCDGAVSSLPARVTLRGLEAGSVVKLRLTAGRDLQRPSWQAASRTEVGDKRFTTPSGSTGLVVGCDLPEAEIVAGGVG